MTSSQQVIETVLPNDVIRPAVPMTSSQQVIETVLPDDVIRPAVPVALFELHAGDERVGLEAAREQHVNHVLYERLVVRLVHFRAVVRAQLDPLHDDCRDEHLQRSRNVS